MNKMMLWFFHIMILGTGVMWHVGLLTYMLTNNIWTFCQQYFLYKKMDKEKLEAKEKLDEARAANAPRPGAKPKRDKHGKVIVVEQPKVVETAVVEKKPRGFSALFKRKGDGAAETSAAESGSADAADSASDATADSAGGPADAVVGAKASDAAVKSVAGAAGAKSSPAGAADSAQAEAKAQRQAAQRARQQANKNRKGKKKKKR